jgi:CO/xanthine dehydrogenase FAD-binding subunit
VKPAPFAYYDPRTVDEAVSLLAQHGSDAKVLAGGQSLMPLLNMRLARPAVVVDVNRVDGLDYIRQENGTLAIGALTRQRAVERSGAVAQAQPLLAAATRLIAHPQIRNRGTVGGSIAHADPAAEYPAVALALGAELRVAGPRGERSIRAEDFFVTYLTTALEPDELVTEVRLLALPPRTGWSVMELSRRHGDFALAGVAATLTLAASGECAGARIVLFGVGPTPLRATAAEQLLPGVRLSDALVDAAADSAAKAIEEPLSDIHASGDYRRHLARVLTKRALVEAAGRAQEAS